LLVPLGPVAVAESCVQVALELPFEVVLVTEPEALLPLPLTVTDSPWGPVTVAVPETVSPSLLTEPVAVAVLPLGPVALPLPLTVLPVLVALPDIVAVLPPDPVTVA